MPVYDYCCTKCGWAGELIQVPYGRRDDQVCPDCPYMLLRVFKNAPALHGPGYQMQAVLANGEHIKGHFGKEAKRRRKK